jgi:hypothetical protein
MLDFDLESNSTNLVDVNQQPSDRLVVEPVLFDPFHLNTLLH